MKIIAIQAKFIVADGRNATRKPSFQIILCGQKPHELNKVSPEQNAARYSVEINSLASMNPSGAKACYRLKHGLGRGGMIKGDDGLYSRLMIRH
jgi:hypothetical protein